MAGIESHSIYDSEGNEVVIRWDDKTKPIDIEVDGTIEMVFSPEDARSFAYAILEMTSEYGPQPGPEPPPFTEAEVKELAVKLLIATPFKLGEATDEQIADVCSNQGHRVGVAIRAFLKGVTNG